MRSENEHHDAMDGETYKELRVLEEVDGASDLSQRRLAHKLGIALGVANLLLRELARRGYIRVTQLGWRRWAYVITPAGMARKLQLTVAYVERFIGHYKRVRLLLREELQGRLNEESSVAIIGTGELAELAFLALRDIGVEEIEVYDFDTNGTRFLGMKVQDSAKLAAGRFTRVILAVPSEHEKRRRELATLGVNEAQMVEILRPPALSASAARPLPGDASGGDGPLPE